MIAISDSRRVSTYGDVVDPDVVGGVESDGITTPDVLGVDVLNLDVLDDDVLGTGDSQTLADNDTLGAGSDDGLVGGNLDGVETGLVVGNRDGGGAGLVVVAPRVLVDGDLAGGGGSPGSTAGLGSGAVLVGEVEGLGQDDDTGRRVAEVRDQLVVGGGGDGSRRASTGGARGETLGGTGDGDSSGLLGKGRSGQKEGLGEHLGKKGVEKSRTNERMSDCGNETTRENGSTDQGNLELIYN